MNTKSVLAALLLCATALTGCAQSPSAATKFIAPTVDDCSRTPTLYTDIDAEHDIGGSWSGTGEAIKSSVSGICSYALAHTKTKATTASNFDFITFVTTQSKTVIEATDYYQQKMGDVPNPITIADVGEKAFIEKSAGPISARLVMLVDRTVVSVFCTTLCTDTQYQTIARTIAGRMATQPQ